MHLLLEINWTDLKDGILISVVGYVVVLISLAALYFAFRYLPIILRWQMRRRLRRKGLGEKHDASHSMSGDEAAAIAAALYMYFNEVHDDEQTVMTIRKISKTYSPWSSKIFGVMNPTWRR